MPRFEVFCPAAPPLLTSDVTLRVDAEHWLAALKTGLDQLGELEVSRNVLCDIQPDGAIHVTDPRGGGVFRIHELRSDAAPAQPQPPSRPPGRVPAAHRDRIEQLPQPSSPPPAHIGRVPRGRSPQDVLEELFARVADLEGDDRDGALGFLLDLAIEKVDAEAGSVFFARLAGNELRFALARGPRAEELLQLGAHVPMGVGVVGFCAQENVCLAVSDAEKDPRFYRAISEAIGYQTRSLICVPIAWNGQVLGAIEVMNKRAGAVFEQRDLAVVSYLAHRAAELLTRIGT